MNTPQTGLRIAALIFAIICLAHIWRVVRHVDVRLGRLHAPMWWSVVAILVSGALSIWLVTLSKRKNA